MFCDQYEKMLRLCVRNHAIGAISTHDAVNRLREIANRAMGDEFLKAEDSLKILEIVDAEIDLMTHP